MGIPNMSSVFQSEAPKASNLLRPQKTPNFKKRLTFPKAYVDGDSKSEVGFYDGMMVVSAQIRNKKRKVKWKAKESKIDKSFAVQCSHLCYTIYYSFCIATRQKTNKDVIFLSTYPIGIVISFLIKRL